jgi:FtsZ-interacting cell division protein ZipA
MNTTLVVIGVIVLVALVLGAIWFSMQQKRRRETEELRERFGPEYERAVDTYGEKDEAEKELAARKERVERLHLRNLSGEQSTRYARHWRAVQAQFVDDPEQAIAEADRLVIEVMQTRGYPMVEFEQRAADVSVDHPHVVEHYRAAHAIAGRSARGDANTEDLRQAMVHYRALFEDLIDAHETMEVRNEHAA